ncbi:MAG TPA: DUF1592 domain-containing protein [Polyangiaceae bacterium]|nr:DUF1592 domain-containing protein [Polyangiaceae bacterium]
MATRTWRIPTPAGVVALGALALACTGVIEDGEGKNGSPGGPGSGSGAGSGAGTGNPPGTQIPLAEDPGRKDMHRLNSAEYNATVLDVLGTTLQPANASWRGGEIEGFDNIATQLGIDDTQYERYFNAADALAEEVFASPDLKGRYVTCATVDDAACVQGIISNAGLHIFRRPLTQEEVGTYYKGYQAARALGDDHDLSLKVVLRGLLSSAEFLYRIEFDPDPTSNVPHPVAAYELASRLSYFLWSSAPDDTLLGAAADNSITTDAGLIAAVDRMLTDGKASRLIENFSGQWLGARQVMNHAADATIYPTWNPELAAASSREVYQYFAEFLLTERSWLDFLKADINFVEAPLAALYGVTAPTPGRMEITTDNRAGYFGLAGFLANSSMAARTSPTLRGRWILINMLCVHPEPPPANVPELEDSVDVAALSVRERLEAHRANPACAGCHSVIDPYGLALEQFDGIGAYRTAYADGTVIDASTTLPPLESYPQGTSFTGLAGLADTVTQDPKFTSCVGEKLLTYGLGRVMGDTDKPYLTAVRDEWVAQGTPSLRSLIRSLVLSDPFRLRRGETAN